jgi:hypothetical protein
MHNNGIINADQWLDLEDMNPQEGGQGQMYLVQSSVIPKSNLLGNDQNEGAPASRGVDAAVLASHRRLLVDVIRRLVERETDRAKSRSQSHEKLRGWLATFYVTFVDGFTEAILPALRVHLAWKQSKDDPRAFAQQIAEQHCADSKRQIEALLVGESQDLAVALPHLLTRWETDRPEALADAILQDHVAPPQASSSASAPAMLPAPIPTPVKQRRPRRRVIKEVTRDRDGRIVGGVIEDEDL